MKNLKVEKNVAVFEAFYPLNLSLFDVKRGFNCSIPFYKIHVFFIKMLAQLDSETAFVVWFEQSVDQLLLSNGFLPVFERKHIAAYDFPGGGRV